MKKQLAMAVCVMALLAGCGQNAQEDAHDHDHAQESTQQEETDAEDAEEEVPANRTEEQQQMLDTLQALPAEVTHEVAEEEGFYTIADGAVVSGQEKWDAFVQAAENGEEASIVLCQYSMKGGAMLDYLTHQAEGGYVLASDRSRDGYEKEEMEKQNYHTEVYADLKIFENFSLQEGGTTYTIGVLTNETELDADTFRTYWTEMTTEAHGVYLLFVI